MARRAPRHSRGRGNGNGDGTRRWLLTIANSNITTLIALAGVVGVLYGFYFRTTSTLDAHTAQFTTEASARDALRKEYLDTSQRAAAGIEKLNVQIAVQQKTQEITNIQLDKIATQLGALATTHIK